MKEDHNEALIPDRIQTHIHDESHALKPSPQKQISEVSGQSAMANPLIYDLPDMGNITRGVICKLVAVSFVCIIFLAAEIVGGILASSLAILSDAAHLFSDLSGFFISIFSIWLGQQPSSQLMSFGYHRAEVIGALVSIILIWALTILLLYEATMRIIDRAIVENPLIMLITAAFGLFCNLVMAKVLHSSPTGGDDHGGNIFHQCDHDHGPKGGTTHNHDHQHKKIMSSPKKNEKISILKPKNLMSDQQIEIELIDHVINIKEDPEENNNSSFSKEEHNHSHDCDHDKKNVHAAHAHSDFCEPVTKYLPPGGSVSQFDADSKNHSFMNASHFNDKSNYNSEHKQDKKQCEHEHEHDCNLKCDYDHKNNLQQDKHDYDHDLEKNQTHNNVELDKHDHQSVREHDHTHNQKHGHIHDIQKDNGIKHNHDHNNNKLEKNHDHMDDHNHEAGKHSNQNHDHIHAHLNDHKHDHKQEHKPDHNHVHDHNQKQDHRHHEHHVHDHDHDHDHHDHNHHKHNHHEHNHHGHDDHDHNLHDHNHEDHDHHDHHDHDHHDHDHHDHNHNHLHQKGQKEQKNLSHMKESDNYNLRAAMIHVIGDIVQSLGVLLAAILLYIFKEEKDGRVVYNDWQLVDPICTYLFSVLVLFTTFGVAKECLKVIMEGTPSGMVYSEFRDKLKAIPRVQEVHDLHIWSLSVGKPAMSAHIVCSENPEYVLKKATIVCREFGIYHSTIQIEQADRLGKTDYIKCNHNLHQ